MMSKPPFSNTSGNSFCQSNSSVISELPHFILPLRVLSLVPFFAVFSQSESLAISTLSPFISTP